MKTIGTLLTIAAFAMVLFVLVGAGPTSGVAAVCQPTSVGMMCH